MGLAKVSLLSGVSVAIKLLTLLGLNKVLAIYVGPTGYATLGQYQNIIQLIATFTSGAINTGVTRLTAEYGDNKDRQQAVWRTAGSMAVMGSLIASLLICLFSKYLASKFLGNEELRSVFVWFSLTLIFFVANTLLLAILSGKKDIYRLALANIIGSLLTMVITGYMAINFGLYGVLLALAIYQSLSFIATAVIIYKATWFKFRYLVGKIDKKIVKELGKSMSMALTSAICIPITNIMIREHLIEVLGLDYAGYWEAMGRVSSAYLMFITAILGVYYLPALAEQKNIDGIKREIIRGYKAIIPIVIVIGIGAYLCRYYIIEILFTSDFQKMEVLFPWQIAGDIFKIASWILSYLMLSKSMVAMYIFTEIIFSLALYISTLFFTNLMGLEGAAIAYFLVYFFYLTVISYLINSWIKNNK
jgi:PST family polysaccharide transporter